MKNFSQDCPPLFVQLDVPYEVLLDSGIDPGGALQFTAEEGRITVEQIDRDSAFSCTGDCEACPMLFYCGGDCQTCPCARHCDKSKIGNPPLEAFLDGLSAQDQYAALVHLTTRWAERRTGGTA